jgi:spore coat protein CotH
MNRTCRRGDRLSGIVASGVALLALAACTTDADASTDTDSTSAASTETVSTEATAMDLGGVGTLATDETHEISLVIDDAEYAAMLDTYGSTGDKEWIDATITIDGATYDNVGIRLKGNSSLRGVSADAEAETLPWLIKLDKFVDDQRHDGLTDLVIRSNNSATALNEAVALELLDLAGLASQDAIAVAFSVNGGDAVLRLAIEHPDDSWMAEELEADGALYKAESTGDYSYRGDDPDSYDEVFDQEAGDDNADLTPLMAFLEFINNSDDATFADELDEWLDTDAFATYLALQELLDNFDDIDGPGNNSYLFYSTESETFTVVAWDHNLAFGQTPGGPGGPAGVPGDDPSDARPGPGGSGAPGGAAPPNGVAPPSFDGDGQSPVGGFGGGAGDPGAGDLPGGAGFPGGQANVLVDRFLANDEWQSLYTDRLAELRSSLYDSGIAAKFG